MADGYRQVSDDSRVAVVHVREHREIMDVCAFRYSINSCRGLVARAR